MSRAEEIAGNVARVRERLARAAERSGRPAEAVTLLAVSKTRPLSDLVAAHAAGVRHFGENRIQEAEAKFPSLPPGIEKHLIGPLQANKVNRGVRVADVIQTVDGLDLVTRLARAALLEKKTLPVFIEVRLGGESTKAGVDPEDVAALADAIRKTPLPLRGLMAIPPPGATRPHFAALRKLAHGLHLAELSMGMSDDFEEAVEEGSTLVRIGSAIFGAR